MNNRLGDLGEDVPAWALDPDDGNMGAGTGDLEMASVPLNNNNNGYDNDDPWGSPSADGTTAPKQAKHMEQFFKDVDQIKDDIEVIRNSTVKIGEINEEAVLATTTEKENDLSNQLRPLVNLTNKRAKNGKNLLTLLKEDNAKLKDDKDVLASDLRIRENLCNTLTRKFIDEMKSYQSAQQKYKADIKNKMKRQVQIVKPDATDSEIEQVMKDEGGRDKLFKETILAGGVNESITTAYNNVAGKYQDVLTLEQSVTELYQMFLDFAILTEQQGELLDQIQFQVDNAKDHIEAANVEVVGAIEHSKAARKKQCMIIVIVLVVVGVLFFFFGPGG